MVLCAEFCVEEECFLRDRAAAFLGWYVLGKKDAGNFDGGNV